MSFKYILIILILVSINHGSSTGRILGLFPSQGRSHFNMFEPLMKELANRGHEVVVLSHFPQKKSIPRYTDINVTGSLPLAVNHISIDMVADLPIHIILMSIFNEGGTELCKSLFNHSEVQKLKNTNVKYDLIITETFGTDCFLGFSHIFNIPVIAMSSSILMHWGNRFSGNIDNPSYIRSLFLPYKEMNLYERTVNTAIMIFSNIGYHYFSTIPCTKIAREFFGSDLPMLDDLARNISVILVNSHYSIIQARPFNPNVIEVGGLHLKPPKKLDTDLETFMNSSKNGVIYFSFGSMVQPETLPINILKALIDSFGSSPYDVLWKADLSKISEPLPKNIKFGTWFPQSDILCHPNTKLFITHGGNMGTQEAIYCGVPLLGVPFFGDQYLNIINYEKHGLAVSIMHNEITKDRFSNLLKTVLENPSYKANAVRMQSLFNDRAVKPMDLAVWSVEHVLKNKGAPHLRPESVNLWWFQYFLLDVILVFIICLLFLSVLIYYVLRLLVTILRKIFKSNKVKQN